MLHLCTVDFELKRTNFKKIFVYSRFHHAAFFRFYDIANPALKELPDLTSHNISYHFFHAHGQVLKIVKITNFEALKVNEDEIFEL